MIGKARVTPTQRSRLSSGGARELSSRTSVNLQEAIPAVRGLVRRSMSIPVTDLPQANNPSKSCTGKNTM